MSADTDYVAAVLPAGATEPGVIICERSGRWAVALRRELGAAAEHVHETRILADCWERLETAPASFVILEFRAGGVGEVLQRTARLERDFPLARLAVVANRSLADYQWLVREAGAVHFICSPRQSGPLASLALRHLARAPRAQRSLSEEVWAALPWEREGRSEATGATGEPKRLV